MQEMVAASNPHIFARAGREALGHLPISTRALRQRRWILPRECSSEVEPTENLEPGRAAQPSAREGWVTLRSPSPGQLGWRLGDRGDAIPVPSNTKIRLYQ